VSRPRRLTGFSYLGPHQYSLTFCTRKRQRVFLDPDHVATTLTAIRKTALEEQFALLVYCVMPDHVHLLVEGLADTSDLRRFAKRAKQRAGAHYALHSGKPLWQEGYFEHVLRGEENAKTIARYIIENPVRAGLVNTPFEYPHIGSDVWILKDLIETIM
jgi:putative transposase